MEWLGEGGVHGAAAELEAAGEGVEMGQIFGPGLLDPAGQSLVAARIGRE